ncbi:MAG: cobyrinic acid a,c-diamide synthase, partial [Cyanobacteria bacterium P01_F01_bin.42]
SNFRDIQDRLADLGDRCMDWTALTPLMETHPSRPSVSDKKDGESAPELGNTGPVRIAIARDAAFNFYYEDNLDALRALGADLEFWSPLSESVPEGINGVVLGGGFPEQFAPQLSQNQATRLELQALINGGLPAYAECGGLMYLCETLQTFDQKSFPMVGVIPNGVQMRSKLNLGYRALTLQQKNRLFYWSESIYGHEFHHSQLQRANPVPLMTLQSLSQPHLPAVEEGFGGPSLHASYVHLHWGNKPFLAEQFVKACCNYGSVRNEL